MFWRFGGYSNISSIDTILDKPDVTLEDLLEESDLIQELKQQNSKLIEFLREEAVLKRLFQYVIADKESLEKSGAPSAEQATDGPEKSAVQDKGKEVDKQDKSDKSAPKMSFFGRSRSRSKSVNKRGHVETEDEKKEAQRLKYAYVACEVLSAEVWSITEAMLEYQDALREFWDYLRRPAPLDPVQAGYFTKVNDTLLDKKTEEMFALLKSLDGIVPEMLEHVDCPMIMDLLLKMISLEKHEGGQGIVDWLQGQGLIPILLSYLSPDNPPATQTAAGDFLKAIITISANATGQDQTVIGPNELTRQLVSEKCVTKLIKDMLHGGNPLTVGVGIVIEVIRKNNSDYDLDTQVGPEPRATDPIYLGTLLREFAKSVPAFMDLIRSSRATKPELSAAFGGKIQPLGFDRFKTCELMAELLHCSNMGLLNERGSDAEMRARDAERESLKAQGRLKVAPLAGSEADEAFASSVDSHGFHHARAPEDDFESVPDKIDRLEVQNTSEEDGFEKVGVSDAEPLPDEVSFDEFNEKMEEEETLPPAPLRLSKSPERQLVSAKDIENPPSPSEDSSPSSAENRDRRRVSLLTKQIQDHIDETGQTEPTTQSDPMKSGGTHPDDKPAPLFARSSSPSKSSTSAPGPPSPTEEGDAGNQSVATLLPDTHEGGDSQEHPQPDESDVDGSPLVGDYLKMQFVQHDVVPTILDFFFRFPWNNFLHNVVYDVVQQVFNGSLERGYNRMLAQNLFMISHCEALASKHEITRRILEGQSASDKSQSEKGMRLGYMGHLTLIAEEVCKFAERSPAELLGDAVMECITAPQWVTYVEGVLTETRDKDNAVLGGVRPEQNMGLRTLGGSMLGGQGGFGGNSSALASAGLGTPSDSLALHDQGTGGFDVSGGGFGDGDEDEMDEGEERKTLDDDEQASGSSASGLPPPLNIGPSRARLQLAARLAARKRAAAEADPDSVDQAALDEALHLSRDEPIGNDTEAASPSRLPFTIGQRRSTFDDDDETSSDDVSSDEGLVDHEDSNDEGDAGREIVYYHEDSSDEDSEEEEELLVAGSRHRPPPPTPPPPTATKEVESPPEPVRRPSTEEESRGRGSGDRKTRRPSTTEAKVRRPIEGSDDEAEEVVASGSGSD